MTLDTHAPQQLSVEAVPFLLFRSLSFALVSCLFPDVDLISGGYVFAAHFLVIPCPPFTGQAFPVSEVLSTVIIVSIVSSRVAEHTRLRISIEAAEALTT